MEIRDKGSNTISLTASPVARHDCGKILRIYADRSGQRWIVLDSKGEFWELPFGASSWELSQSIEIDDNLELEPIPGHYKYQLGLPL